MRCCCCVDTDSGRVVGEPYLTGLGKGCPLFARNLSVHAHRHPAEVGDKLPRATSGGESIET